MIWLAINASTGQIVKDASRPSDIPPSEWVEGYAEKNRAVMLIYLIGSTLDSMDARCRPGADLAGYPRLGISGVLGADQEKEVVHFDTGNSFTLLAYEYFLEHGWYAPIKNPELRQQGAYRLYGATVVLRNRMIEDCAGNSVVADIKGFAVIEWSERSFALRCEEMNCGEGTVYPAKEAVRLCRRRVALVGRNLGQEIDRRFIVDVITGKLMLWTEAL